VSRFTNSSRLRCVGCSKRRQRTAIGALAHCRWIGGGLAHRSSSTLERAIRSCQRGRRSDFPLFPPGHACRFHRTAVTVMPHPGEKREKNCKEPARFCKRIHGCARAVRKYPGLNCVRSRLCAPKQSREFRLTQARVIVEKMTGVTCYDLATAFWLASAFNP